MVVLSSVGLLDGWTGVDALVWVSKYWYGVPVLVVVIIESSGSVAFGTALGTSVS